MICPDCGHALAPINGRCYWCAPVTDAEARAMLAYATDSEHDAECRYCGGYFRRADLPMHRLCCHKRLSR